MPSWGSLELYWVFRDFTDGAGICLVYGITSHTRCTSRSTQGHAWDSAGGREGFERSTLYDIAGKHVEICRDIWRILHAYI